MVSLNTQQGRPGGVRHHMIESLVNRCAAKFPFFSSAYQGMSFDDRFTNVNDETSGENIPLIAATEQPYRAVRTTGFIVIHILFVVSLTRISQKR